MHALTNTIQFKQYSHRAARATSQLAASDIYLTQQSFMLTSGYREDVLLAAAIARRAKEKVTTSSPTAELDTYLLYLLVCPGEDSGVPAPFDMIVW